MNHQQDISESVRLQYLAAMGITSWLPMHDRIATCGAVWQATPIMPATSTQGVPPEAPITSASEVEVDVGCSQLQPAYADQAPSMGITAVQVKQQAQEMRDNLLQDSAITESAKPLAQDVVIEAAPCMGDQIEPLHLSYSWYSVGVLVINEVPLQDGAAMTSSLAQLQTAMVNALALGSKAVMPQSQGEFHWPLVPGVHGDHSRSGAQQALQYQLQKLLQDKPVARVMLMGQRCAEVLIDDAIKPGMVFREPQWPEADILLTHSLHQLLKIPSTKADAWAHMQPLLAE